MFYTYSYALYRHVHTSVHVYMLTYIYTYKDICTYIHTYIHTYKCLHTRSWFAHINKHTFVRTYVHVYMHACVHTYACIHTQGRIRGGANPAMVSHPIWLWTLAFPSTKNKIL